MGGLNSGKFYNQRNINRFMKLLRILFIAVIICVVQFSSVSAWRSELFPINWVPVDEEVVVCVNVFSDSAWAVDE